MLPTLIGLVLFFILFGGLALHNKWKNKLFNFLSILTILGVISSILVLFLE